MTNEELYLAVALNGWKGNIERADKMFSGLSDQEVLREIAPGKNRLIYLWGHLTATHDTMLPLLGIGQRLHPGFDVAFISNPDKTQAGIPSAELVRKAWREVNGRLFEGFASLSAADWLKKHGAVSEEEFLAAAFPCAPASQAEALLWCDSGSTLRNADPFTPEPSEPEDC